MTNDNVNDDDNDQDSTGNNPNVSIIINANANANGENANKKFERVKESISNEDEDEDEVAEMERLLEFEEQNALLEAADGHNHHNRNNNGNDNQNDHDIQQRAGGRNEDDANPDLEALAAARNMNINVNMNMDGNNDNGNANGNDNNNNQRQRGRGSSFLKSNYTLLSILISILHILYVLRTRKQVYLALMFITTSRISYILIGNTILSTFVSLFQYIIKKFLNGLRMIESETIIENVRWSATESVFALTMFRQEINVKMMGMFLIMIWCKCLHWAVELRGTHLRMTEEVLYFVDDDDVDVDEIGLGDMNGVDEHAQTQQQPQQQQPNNSWVTTIMSYILPTSIQKRYTKLHKSTPRIRSAHLKYLFLMNLLYTIDFGAIAYCAGEIIESGPNANILFLFEAAIMLITIMSSYCLFMIHSIDGFVNVVQRLTCSSSTETSEVETAAATTTTATETSTTSASTHQKIIGQIASFWRDNRNNASFSIELMALAAKFLFHFILFIVVFATYGLPISIIRDFYLSYLKLRRRLTAFVSYRRLTSNMNKRFQTIDTEEELERVGKTCIICRDVMDVQGIHGVCKKLPGCGHAFHKHCLREWLVQSQSCPTCRADIQANEARTAREAREEKEEQEQQQEAEQQQQEVKEEEQEQQQEENNDDDYRNNDTCIDGDSNSDNDENLETFPFLGKVTERTLVVDFTTKGDCKDNGQNNKNEIVVCQKIKRIVNPGVLMACLEKKSWQWNSIEFKRSSSHDDDDGDDDAMNIMNIKEALLPNGSGADVFVKVPDFWLRQIDIENLLKLQNKN